MTNRVFDRWMKNKVKLRAFAVTLAILWLIVIGWVAYGWNLGSIGLIDETEPLFAEASRQMLVTGDWITPFFDSETRFDKPALIYWCQALAYSIVGVNEWAVRLPSAIAAFCVISLAFYTLQWHFLKKDDLENVSRPSRRWLTACLGSAVMAFNPEMIVWGRTGVSDMLLTGCMTSALLCFFLGYASKENQDSGVNSSFSPSLRVFASSSRWYLAFYVLIAAAILTKGPIGIVLPGLIIGAFVLYLGNWWEVLQEMHLLFGMLIVLCLSVPWYALVIWRNGWNYINSFFGYHNLERFAGVVNGHAAPWYFYFVVVLLGFAPYSVYLPVAIARLKFWRRKYWRFQERSEQLGLFAFFWFVGVFGFFTIAVTKLPSYVLPLMPSSAILVALLWSDLERDPRTHKGFQVGREDAGMRGRRDTDNVNEPLSVSPLLPVSASSSSSPTRSLLWSGWINVSFLSALAIALFNLPQLIGNQPDAPNFRQLLQQSGLHLLGGVMLLFGAVILTAFLIRRNYHKFLYVNLLIFAAFFIFVLTPTLFLMDRERQLPLRELSAIAVQAQQPSEELVMVGFKKPSVVFYTQKPVNYLKLTKIAAKHIQEQSVKKVQPPSMLIISKPMKFVEMGLKPNDYRNLGTRGVYELIRVPLNRE
ncbi:MAG: glycosyltransferase family 39 protein [Rhizonema sp. NSF051]|nr:glycosyltransferase family 39 protein [Rhizonema sp. NSF051]